MTKNHPLIGIKLRFIRTMDEFYTTLKNILNSNFNYLGCGSYDYLDRSYGDRYIKSTQNFSN